MAQATKEMACWRLGQRQPKSDIVYRAPTKQQATDTLSRLITKGDDRTPLIDEVSDLTVLPESLTCAPLTVKPDEEAKVHSKRACCIFSTGCLLVGGYSRKLKGENINTSRIYNRKAHNYRLSRQFWVSWDV